MGGTAAWRVPFGLPSKGIVNRPTLRDHASKRQKFERLFLMQGDPSDPYPQISSYKIVATKLLE